MEIQKTIYVGGIDEKVNTGILKSLFIPFGNIVEVKIPLDQNGLNRGFGYVGKLLLKKRI
jgi:peptidyl-prolyl isomerase E (cyclophilin E)